MVSREEGIHRRPLVSPREVMTQGRKKKSQSGRKAATTGVGGQPTRTRKEKEEKKKQQTLITNIKYHYIRLSPPCAGRLKKGRGKKKEKKKGGIAWPSGKIVHYFPCDQKAMTSGKKRRRKKKREPSLYP